VIIRERFTVPAPREAVWAFLLDVPRSSACMPGVSEVVASDDGGFRGRIEVKVGPLKAGFATTVAIAETIAPERIVLAIRGGDRGGSMVQATVTTTLEAAGPDETGVAYEMDVTIRGPLGRFGQTVIQDTARKLSRQFAECVEHALTSDHDHA
jgi:uncharacterized protein